MRIEINEQAWNRGFWDGDSGDVLAERLHWGQGIPKRLHRHRVRLPRATAKKRVGR